MNNSGPDRYSHDSDRGDETSVTRVSEKESATGPPHIPFPIVGIGASAGGIEAVLALLHQLPSTLGMGLVLVVHLDRNLPSRLVELLKPQCPFPVVEAQDGLLVEPNHLYVIPPNKDLTISCGMLQVSPRTKEKRLYEPIDCFLISLAREHGEQSLTVILSGMGSDGSSGVKEIKARGGISFAQEEKSAKYPSMPKKAIETGVVDFILPPEEIGRELIVLSKALQSKNDRTEPRVATSEARLREELLAVLHARTEVDFANYKQSTIWRRVHRRMAIKRLTTLREYIDYCRATSNEIDSLYQDILINVTSFFRDAEVFECLEEKVFPNFVSNRNADDPVRIWVPGCSTGEEAYSLAMALIDFSSKNKTSIPIQIFGTDINESVVERARTGLYTARISENVSADRLERFFTKVPYGYQVTKAVRDLCVFARQNIVSDPPLSRMDFISCRNLLIYLGPTLQRKVIPRLHYGLKPHGFLLLGKSEVIDIFSDLFFSVDKRTKIHGKKPGSPTRVELSNQVTSPSLPVRRNQPAGAVFAELETQREADRLIATRYSPPALIIDNALNIIQVRGDIKPYLDMGSGLWNNDLEKLVQHDFARRVRELVAEAMEGKSASKTLEGLKLRTNGTVSLIDLRFIPLRTAEANERRFLLILEAHKLTPAPSTLTAAEIVSKDQKDLHDEIARLTEELRLNRDHLQSTIDEREIRNEELQAANEEILSNNEELQTLNQELETSKEELESSNEELSTLNEELQRHLERLRQSEERFRILVSGVREYAIFMMDPDGYILSWNEGAQRIKGYKSEEIIGKHFGIFYPPEVARTSKLKDELEIAKREGSYSEEGTRIRKDGTEFWASVVITALHDEKGEVYGFAKVTRDITERRHAEENLRLSEERFRILVSGVKDYAIFMMDPNGHILSWNEGAQRIKGYQAEEIIGKHFSTFYTEEDKKRHHPEDELKIAKKVGKYEEEGIRVRKDGSTFVAHILITALYGSDGVLRGFGKVTRDVTAQKKAEALLQQAHASLEKRVNEATETVKRQAAQLSLITNALPTLIAYIDLNGRYTFNNGAFERWFNRPSHEFTGELVSQAIGQKAFMVIKPYLDRAIAGENAEFETLLRYDHGPARYIHGMYIPDFASPGKIRGVISLVDDITERKRQEEELRRYSSNLAKVNADLTASNAELSQFAHISSHDLKEPLRMVKVYTEMIDRSYREKLDTKGRKYMAFVIEGVTRMEALINDLLAYSAVGRTDIALDDADLKRAADIALSNLTEAINESSAKVLIDDLPLVKGNEGQLSQVLQNLIGNAIKFRGTEPPVVRISYEVREADWLISVKDNGIGIEPQYFDKIFVIFQRLHDRSKFPGTGIGLAICKRIIERLGGKIWVVSAPRKGSTFFFTIPKEPRVSDGSDTGIAHR